MTQRLSYTAQNELMNIVTIFVGLTVGATANGEAFLSISTLTILVLGAASFALATAGESYSAS